MSKRLLIGLATDGHGGCEYSALSVAKYLKDSLRWDVQVAVPRRASTELVWNLCARNGLPALEIEADFSRSDDPAKVAADKQSWWRVLDRAKPDTCFIPLPWPKRGLSLVSGSADCGLPTVVKFALVPEVMDVAANLAESWRAAFNSNQAWFANSRYSAALIERHLKLKNRTVDSFHVGPIGLDTLITYKSKPDSAVCRSEMRASLGIPHDACVAITVARLAEQKGYRVYMDVVRQLFEENRDLWLLWVGDGELKEELMSEAAKLPRPERIKILGFRNDVRALLRVSDIFVLPTFYEGGCSQALLEAMEEGVAVAIADVSAVAEVVCQKKTALLFPRQDAQALREAISCLASCPELRTDLAKRASERVKRYSRDIMYLNTLKQIDKVLNSNYAGGLSISTPALDEDEVPHWFNEKQYLETYDDVRREVEEGRMKSGFSHYMKYGRFEMRQLDS